MLFSFLQELRNNTNDKEFKEILKITSDDIKFNRVSFGKTTSQEEFINICQRSYKALRVC